MIYSGKLLRAELFDDHAPPYTGGAPRMRADLERENYLSYLPVLVAGAPSAMTAAPA